ncbi:nucleotidyl transferase AbiEii/AbiGii toxin family protein [Halomonas salifodinae]|uniref:Nucleotidyl transferase AbiEii/AbiGii toxin family protein n=1 Tax=Halomonas salifodinae TaxID=438745 RepID=A0ABW2F029_9GAMM
MIDPADFEKLVARAIAEPGRQAMRPVIEKELLHFDILFALDREGLLDDLTFQGGTSLRLCYGASRFSEDLDFAGGRDFQNDRVAAIKACIETYVSRRYRLEVTVKPPRTLRHEPAYAEVKVDKWQVAVVTSPSRPDLPKQRIKLEIANIPAYTRQARSLQVHYPFLPDGYSDLLVLCEGLDEIMADKLASLVNTQKYVRHRDIWDLQWLKQQGATPNIGLVTQKLRDYRVEDYIGKAKALIDRLPDIIGGDAFRLEMTRFLPADTLERTLFRAKFTDFLCRELSETLGGVVSELEGASPPPQEFRL